MRTILLVALLGGLLVLVPAASAQRTGVLTFRGDLPSHALQPGDSLDLVVAVTLTADETAYLSTPGVPVTYSVAKAPAWAMVTLSPTHDIFPTDLGPAVAAPTYTVVRPLHVQIKVVDDLPQQGRITDAIRLVGATMTPMGTVNGGMMIPLMVDTGTAPCSTTSSLATQDAGVVVTGQAWGVYALAGLAALALGLTVALRARRAGAALAVLAVLLVPALPMASAQRAGAVSFSPLSFHNVTGAGSVQAETAVVTLTSDLTSYSSEIGVPFMAAVTKAPAWATVVLPQATGIFPLPSGAMMVSQSYVSSAPLTVIVMVGDLNFSGPADGVVQITVTTMNQFGSTSGTTSFPLHIVAPPACATQLQPTAVQAASVKATPTVAAPPQDNGLTVQQSTAAPISVPTFAVIGGCAIAGAGIGLVLARKRA